MNNNAKRVFRIKFSVIEDGIILRVFEDVKMSNRTKLIKEHVKIWAVLHLNRMSELIFYPTESKRQGGNPYGVAVLIVEEMGIDWSMVKFNHSHIEFDILKSIQGGKVLSLDGYKVDGPYSYLRQAGAQFRFFLLDNVAKVWNVPIGQLTTESGMVHHKLTNKKISYGDIATIVNVPRDLPQILENRLKSERDFKLIGKMAYYV